MWFTKNVAEAKNKLSFHLMATPLAIMVRVTVTRGKKKRMPERVTEGISDSFVHVSELRNEDRLNLQNSFPRLCKSGSTFWLFLSRPVETLVSVYG